METINNKAVLKQELIAMVDKHIVGQGNQVDAGNALATILLALLDGGAEDNRIGDISDLETDHKDTIVHAINELYDVMETQEMVVSMLRPQAEIKAIYDRCVVHPQLAKNIVFYVPTEGMYYRVNGYNISNGALNLHTIMRGEDSGIRSLTIQITSNGSIVIP